MHEDVHVARVRVGQTGSQGERAGGRRGWRARVEGAAQGVAVPVRSMQV